MSENLRKLLSSSEMSSVPKPSTSSWNKAEKPVSSGIKWIPIDASKISSSKLSDPVSKKNEKAGDKVRQADLKVFEVRFPSASAPNMPKDTKASKSVTFQLIPLKSLPCVNVDKNLNKITANNIKSEDSKDKDTITDPKDPPTKKLRTGSQNAQRNHSLRYPSDTGFIQGNSEEIIMPRMDDFTLYKSFAGVDGPRALIPGQHMDMDIVDRDLNEGDNNFEYWFDQFSKNIGANEKNLNEHRVPEFPSEYDELEKLLTSISNENIKPTFTPIYTEARSKFKLENKENTILVKKKKRLSPKKGMFDMCQPFRNKVTTVKSFTQNQDLDDTPKPKISCKVKNELELYTKTMNVSKSELTPEKVLARRKTIHNKLKQSGHLKFTPVEEYDIHQRAEIFMESVTPDKSYYLASDKEEQLKAFVDSAPPPRKRRKHFTIVDDMLVMAPYSRPGYDSYITLENGTRLLRPPTKLVELVAKAINDSPDCMLQVHQVYTVLQKRFPYFQYMDKGYLTSWRSSIRHALYQKWFRKVQFSAEVINNKGCYWAINRKFTPKEWNLPPKRPEHTSLENLSRRDAEMLHDMERFATSAAAAASSAADSLDETLTDDKMSVMSNTSLWDPCMAVDNLPHSTTSSISLTTNTPGISSSTSTYCSKTPRDPDPMLNLPNTRASQNATPDPFDDPIVIEPDEHNPQSPEPQTQKSDDSGYFGNLLWSPLDRLPMDLDPLSCLSPQPTQSSFSTMINESGHAYSDEPLSLEHLLKVSSSLSPKTLAGGPSW